jgi:hypothetical protein
MSNLPYTAYNCQGMERPTVKPRPPACVIASSPGSPEHCFDPRPLCKCGTRLAGARTLVHAGANAHRVSWVRCDHFSEVMHLGRSLEGSDAGPCETPAQPTPTASRAMFRRVVVSSRSNGWLSRQTTTPSPCRHLVSDARSSQEALPGSGQRLVDRHDTVDQRSD